jgi:hypothetical protein
LRLSSRWDEDESADERGPWDQSAGDVHGTNRSAFEESSDHPSLLSLQPSSPLPSSPRRPILLHPLADRLPAGCRHPASPSSSPRPVDRGCRFGRSIDLRSSPAPRWRKVREVPDQRNDLSLKFFESVLCTFPGEFKDVGGVFSQFVPLLRSMLLERRGRWLCHSCFLPGFRLTRVAIADLATPAAMGKTHHANASASGNPDDRAEGTAFKIADDERPDSPGAKFCRHVASRLWIIVT